MVIGMGGETMKDERGCFEQPNFVDERDGDFSDISVILNKF